MADLNKKALVELIAEKEGLTKKVATEILDVLVDEITKALKNGEKVDLPGLGKFVVKEKKARTGINPTTKEPIEIPASRAPKFKPAKALKEAVK
ncbi:MAG: HU family DNA-binding protein [Erysipelotrichaceae bacterium]|nr:HU family DNA-binding protein [Erysipelotrichaceae bacterium]